MHAASRDAASADFQPWLEHPTLVGLRDRLQLTFDCWNLLDCPDGTSRRSIYLPPGLKESPEAYRRRLDAAKPTGFFRDALRTYAGMLSHCHWLSLPCTLQQVITDVDGRGTDLGVLLFLADLLVLRDGGCLVLELPPLHRWPSEGDRQEAIARGDRLSLPRFVLIPRGDLLNWRLPNADGLPVEITWREPDQAALKPELTGSVQTSLLNAHGGLLPELEHWIYRTATLTDDGLVLRTYKVQPSPSVPSGHQAVLVGRPELFPKRFVLPAFWYTADGAAFGEGDLPHLGLAYQYLNHYRCKSEYEDLLSRTALPVGVRTGLVDQYGFRRGEDGEQLAADPLVLSTSTFLDLPEGVSFEWVEIRARSLAEHRAYLVLLDETMRRDALIPSENRGAGRSETEVSLTAGQSFALLQSMATQKTSLFSTLIAQWCCLTGDRVAPGAGVSITVSPLTPPSRPQPSITEWLQLFQLGVVTIDEIRHQLALAAAGGMTSPANDNRPDRLAPPVADSAHSHTNSHSPTPTPPAAAEP
ncbi:DUF4055 domain-containing protein [Synechococcus sp. Cruz-9H2]|nr:DUF4055 domain-containing protein [Synechococcus sp. Cruz-9H2]MCP9844085.1 DUF4055 domain-containing protein [Synechococcus sp. Edmonson 11F2]MCP9856279.1 DUF4055 domain-containing protein [Synechococcus sp. Cruz-9C9]MCP9863564.1 DUF4055 domain-containing protein [Synechococcus sp. Cruz-7E5]MCP9870760.1 DUF4055 domain-containing protein [Synechococcus sp. Cruz-7B9]